MKTISIIVPVYNVANYLDKCISSIHPQLSDDVELILVDDGSTDGVSSEMCDMWARRDSRITVIHKKNGGLSDARNAGLKLAVGKYVFFVDSDDYIEANTLEVLKNYIKLDDELIVFNYKSVDDDNLELGRSSFRPGLIDISDVESKIEFIACKLTKYTVGWEAWNRIFRKDIIDKYNITFYDNKTIFAEDLYFSLCYFAHINSFRVIPNIFYNHLIRSTSIMGRESHLNNLARFSLLSECVYMHYSSCLDCDRLIENFPIINAEILYIEIPRTMEVEQYGIKGLCNEFKSKLPNRSFQHKMIKSFPKYTKYLKKHLSDWQLQDQISTMKYVYDANYLKMKIRDKLFLEKKKCMDKKDKGKKIKEYSKFAKNHNKIYIIGSEEYGNLGDNKITEAIIHFLKDKCPNYAIKEVTSTHYFNEKEHLKNFIRDEDIIVLTGGGNLGDVYPIAERIRHDVINTWKKNKKIIFPQTIFFESSEAFARSKETYTNDNNIILFTRDKASYELAKCNYSCRTYLVPDIVLYENEEKSEVRGDTILLCFRNDIEKSISTADEQKIIDTVCNTMFDVKAIDTQLGYNVSKDDRAAEIERIMQLFRSSRLVITDRLHGMIFATITGTPCIAIDNYNQKISGSYEWIKDNTFICLAKSIDEVLGCIDMLARKDKEFHYTNEKLMPHFNEIAKSIKN